MYCKINGAVVATVITTCKGNKELDILLNLILKDVYKFIAI